MSASYKNIVIGMLALVVVGCGGGGGSAPVVTVTPTPNPAPAPNPVPTPVPTPSPVVPTTPTPAPTPAPPVAPVATGTPIPVLLGQSETFNVTNADSKLNYSWDFGDGTTSTGSSVIHYYNNTGTYNVVVTAKDNSNQSTSTTITIKVEPVVSLIAGSLGGTGIANGTGAEARFNAPQGVATDKHGNIYIADTRNLTIRKITIDGKVSVIAGAVNGYGTEDGQGDTAFFTSPISLAVDLNDNIYVADYYSHTIRKINPTGLVTTFAGKANTSGSINGLGNTALFNHPSGVAVDTKGVVYVADAGNNIIRKITPSGVVSTLAGTAGIQGSKDAKGSSASFSRPSALTVDKNGVLYVIDGDNYTIRKITPSGDVTTFAGTATSFSNYVDGTGAAARFESPSGIAVNQEGVLYVTDMNAIRQITPDAVVSTLTGSWNDGGSVDGTSLQARFSNPCGISVDTTGTIYATDLGSSVIRKISPTGVVDTIAGTPPGYGAVDGIATDARFGYRPQAVTVDTNGAYYVADSANKTIRKISSGVVTTFAGTTDLSGNLDGTGSAARFYYPNGIVTDGSGNMYITAGGSVRKMTPKGVVTTLTGLNVFDGSPKDGSSKTATFAGLQAITIDKKGILYVIDACTVRKISPEGQVTTIAGVGWECQDSIDGNGNAARFSYPLGIAADSNGFLYVSDSYTIRKVSPTGQVTTFAKNLASPRGIAVDDKGIVYVADTGDSAIKKITPSGAVSYIVGFMGIKAYNFSSTSILIPPPFGLALAPGGLVATTDNAVLKIALP